MNKALVSIIILAHVDTKTLHKAIRSSVWADEVLLVTTADFPLHSPATKQVRYPHPLESFAKLRNWSLQQAKHDWVLFLDSDEVLASNAEEKISPLLNRTDIRGVYFTRQDIFLGKRLTHGEASLEILRLVNKKSATFEGNVHEVASVDGPLLHSPVVITHYAHDSVSSFLQKVSRYSQLVAEERSAHGKQFQLWELVLLPPGKFIWNFFIKLGFKDGWRGLLYAVLMSVHSASVRVFLYEKKH